ncbi:MAG: hypothetical protein IPI34_15100 [bacterium]|nr:hypothetical protein [bacterium]
MPLGHQSFRRRRRSALLSLLAASALCAAFAGPAAAQDVPPELVEQALRRSGLTQQELLQRLQEGGAAVADTTLPPGRTALPPGPRVILPFDLETAAIPAAVVAETTLAAEGSLFGADFFRLDPGVFAPPAFGPVPPDYVLGPGTRSAWTCSARSSSASRAWSTAPAASSCPGAAR